MNLDQIVIITDMDGSFLDHNTYSYELSLPAFNAAIREGIPISFCSSKSATEIQPYHEELSVNFPFIAENSSAVYVPKGFFDLAGYNHKKTETYDIIELNVTNKETKEMLHKLQTALPFEFTIFTEMTPEELHQDCGLDIESAERARAKQYADVCKILDETPEKVDAFKKAVEAEGFTYCKGGRYHGVTKGCDKGKATNILLDLYKERFGTIVSVGIGDSQNDLAMLNEVDHPYLVQKPDSTHQNVPDENLNRKIIKVPYIGPKGWSSVVNQVIELN